MSAPASLVPMYALDELRVLASGTPPGHFAEFGVYKGGSAYELAKVARAQGRSLYLFDTFTGIPIAGPHDRHQVGDFSDTSYHQVRELIPEAIMIAGIFPESLVAHGVRPAPLAFVHVDADQYESLAAAIRIFPPLMVQGGLMLFDDYGYVPGATKAVDEWGQAIFQTQSGKALWIKC